MLKCISLFRRKSTLTPLEAQTYWRTEHAAAVKRVAGVRRYVQCHPVLDAIGIEEFPFDGYAEFYVDDIKSLRAMGETSEFKAMTADEENFIDRSSITLILSDEVVIAPGPVASAGPLKTLSLWKKAAEISPQAYRESWLAEGANPEFATSLVRRTLAFPRLSGYDKGRELAVDCIVCDWAAPDAEQRAGQIVPSIAGTLLGSIPVREIVVIE